MTWFFNFVLRSDEARKQKHQALARTAQTLPPCLMRVKVSFRCQHASNAPGLTCICSRILKGAPSTCQTE